MTPKVNQENMPVIFRFGLKTLFNSYLIPTQILCDGYVIEHATSIYKLLKINCFLCDGYVIGMPILLGNHLIKEKL